MSFPVADELLKARNHVPQHLSNPVKMHLRCVCVCVHERMCVSRSVVSDSL